MTDVFSEPLNGPFRSFPETVDAETPISLADYVLGGVLATLVYDRENNISGSRHLQLSDYNEDDVSASLVYDRQNQFSGARP